MSTQVSEKKNTAGVLRKRDRRIGFLKRRLRAERSAHQETKTALASRDRLIEGLEETLLAMQPGEDTTGYRRRIDELQDVLKATQDVIHALEDDVASWKDKARRSTRPFSAAAALQRMMGGDSVDQIPPTDKG